MAARVIRGSGLELIAYPFVAANPPDWSVDWIRAETGDESIDRASLPVSVETDDFHMSKQMAMNSNAVMAAFRSDAARELAAGDLIELDVPTWPPPMPVSIITLHGRQLPPVAV